jgi:hypothetical protein
MVETMDASLQAVSDYLRRYVIDAFNLQFGLNQDWQRFEIVNLQPKRTCHCAFEITNIDEFEHFRIHIYADIAKQNFVDEFVVCDEEDRVSSPASKIYVANAVFSETILNLNNNFIRRMCPSFPSADSQLNVIVDEGFIHAITPEEGGYILIEEADSISM